MDVFFLEENSEEGVASVEISGDGLDTGLCVTREEHRQQADSEREGLGQSGAQLAGRRNRSAQEGSQGCTRAQRHLSLQGNIRVGNLRNE